MIYDSSTAMLKSVGKHKYNLLSMYYISIVTNIEFN